MGAEWTVRVLQSKNESAPEERSRQEEQAIKIQQSIKESWPFLFTFQLQILEVFPLVLQVSVKVSIQIPVLFSIQIKKQKPV